MNEETRVKKTLENRDKVLLNTLRLQTDRTKQFSGPWWPRFMWSGRVQA